MSTAIERVEEFMSYHPNKVVVDDLTELVELAKIGQRARETQHLERECAESEADLGHRNGFNACRDYILGSTS